MTVVRVKGLKRYRVKGQWYAYHRKTGIRLKSEFGTGDFFAELAEIERRLKSEQTLPGTLGLLLSAYRGSPVYANLAASTRRSYAQIINLVKPLQDMPLVGLIDLSSRGCVIGLPRTTGGGRRTTSWPSCPSPANTEGNGGCSETIQ